MDRSCAELLAFDATVPAGASPLLGEIGNIKTLWSSCIPTMARRPAKDGAFAFTAGVRLEGGPDPQGFF